MSITASNLVYLINQLPTNRSYNYINPRNKSEIRIVRIQLPEGPIIIKRYDPSKGETISYAKEESISSNLIWRVANAIQEDVPLNIDRILGASYNTRSVFETLLAYTSTFCVIHPGRVEIIDSSQKIKKGHKHLLWSPNNPHIIGIIKEIETELVISEIPSQQAVYESIVMPEQDPSNILDIEIQRRHAQIQVALILIGLQLRFKTWIAQNDRAIIYNNRAIAEMEGVIPSLNNERLLSAYSDAIHSALLIDCIWFKNGRLMPAVMEIEHTTGINSGLLRMKNFHDKFPPFPTRYAIVAPDEDREEFKRKALVEQFRELNPLFFPFSAVEELYALCQRRKIKGISEEFLDCYMEKLG